MLDKTIKEYVTRDMLIGEIITNYPPASYALMACGMGCMHCGAAQGESLEEAAAVHGLDADEICSFINEWLQDKV